MFWGVGGCFLFMRLLALLMKFRGAFFRGRDLCCLDTCELNPWFSLVFSAPRPPVSGSSSALRSWSPAQLSALAPRAAGASRRCRTVRAPFGRVRVRVSKSSMKVETLGGMDGTQLVSVWLETRLPVELGDTVLSI